MKKKLFALMLTAVMCLSLAACGAKEEAPAASSAPAASTEAPVEDETPAASTEAPAEDETPAEDEPAVEDETPAAPGSSGPSKPVESAPAEKPAQSAPEKQPAPEAQPAPEQGAESASVDLDAFYQSLVQTYGENFPANMNLCEMVEMLDGFYPGLSGLETKQMMVYQPMMGAVVCEIALVEVTNEGDVETVKGIFQSRIDSQVDGGAWYPESIEGWKNNSRIVANGNYIMMIAYSECDAVVNAFNGLFA